MRAPLRIIAPDPEARDLHCQEQSFCLGVAASMDWPGLSCKECTGNKAMTVNDYQRDIEGFAMLWHALIQLGWWERTDG